MPARGGFPGSAPEKGPDPPAKVRSHYLTGRWADYPVALASVCQCFVPPPPASHPEPPSPSHYSRWVDDITLSGSKRLLKFRSMFERIVESEGFQLKAEKTK